MHHRIATSELYRSPPTVVRIGWAFRDWLEAHVMLDVQDDVRAREKASG